MLHYLGYFILTIYIGALVFVSVFCVMQLHLLAHYFWSKLSNNKGHLVPGLDLDNLPIVTIQLPIFNEQFVVERLLANITQLDYPKELIQIQVLDDSTDDTLELSKREVAKYKAQGYDIELLHRVDRTGYKAGALKAAMSSVKGEFIVIFDADFLPSADFIKNTLPHFSNPQIGVVQTRWGHINETYSLLTRLQAFQLNVHFTVEQFGRYAGGFLLQFNGTAGVWRRQTIDEAGGWEADTLTEDLDLSYRAQMKGWKIKFLEHVVSPAELPSEMSGLKSQQYRWMKGGAETAKKLLPTVWRSDLPFRQKVHGTLHLFSSSLFIAILTLSIVSVPLMFLVTPLSIDMTVFGPFILATISIVLVYYAANVHNQHNNKSYLYRVTYFFVLFPLFLALSMAMALHNSVAVVQGFMGKVTAFIRTPKYNIIKSSDTINPGNYMKRKISLSTIVEGLLAVYFIVGVIGAFYTGFHSMLPMHLALSYGYLTIFYLSTKQVRTA